MTLIISYAKEADKFLRRNSTTIAESEIETLAAAAVRKILKKDASSIDLKKMKGKYRSQPSTTEEFYALRDVSFEITDPLEIFV